MLIATGYPDPRHQHCQSPDLDLFVETRLFHELEEVLVREDALGHHCRLTENLRVGGVP